MTTISPARAFSAVSPPRTNSPMRCRSAAAWCFQVLNRTGRGTSQGEPVAEGGVAVTVMVHLPGGDISEASRERQRPEHFELERQRPETSPVADAPGSPLCLALGRPGGL